MTYVAPSMRKHFNEEQRMPQKSPVPADEQIDFDALAAAIRRTGYFACQMDSAGLSRRAVLVLLKDATGLPLADIGRVIDAQTRLASWALRKSATTKGG